MQCTKTEKQANCQITIMMKFIHHSGSTDSIVIHRQVGHTS